MMKLQKEKFDDRNTKKKICMSIYGECIVHSAMRVVRVGPSKMYTSFSF